MTSSIRLSLEGDDGIPLVARVYPSEVTGSKPEDVKEVVVPVEGDVVVRVRPGHYAVALLLPTGRTIQRSCRVDGEGDDEELVFDARGTLSINLSDGDNFSLQGALSEVFPHGLDGLEGVVVAQAIAPAPSETVELERVARPQKANRGGYGRAGRADAGTVGQPNRGLAPATRPTLALLHGSNFQGLDSWEALAAGIPAWKHAASETLDVKPTEAAAFLVTLDELPNGVNRAWVKVSSPAGVELGALPLPWNDAADGSIAVSVDPAITGRAITDIAVHDTAVGGLMTYLDQGRMSLMPALLDALEKDGTIHSCIYDTPSPLAACAAAYAFLAVYSAERDARWETWLTDLASRNAGIPDCAVVLARFRTLQPGVEQTLSAHEALKTAIGAGVPFFSTGLLMLRDMLTAAAVREVGQKEMLDVVAPVAARCDPVRLLTVLRYPRT